MPKNIKILTQGDALRWVLTLAVFVVDAVWLSISHYSVRGVQSLAVLLIALLGLLLLAFIGRLPRYREVARSPYGQRARLTLHCIFQLSVFTVAGGVLQYLAVTLNPPVVDAQLAAWDKLIGFDWAQAFLWVRGSRVLSAVLQIAYASLLLQFIAIPWFLGLSGRAQHLREFVSCIMLSSLLLLLVSAGFPAHSAFTYYGLGSEAELQTISHFDLLRNGTMRVFDIDNIQGLISIPSYHAALAVILTYVLRDCRPLFLLASALNLVMILSTPTEGGHYLVDTFAGLGLAAVTIAAMRWAARREHQVTAHYDTEIAPG
ncbi:MAG: phosphatase PAP2 family protein [Pseudomonadota bacterium]